MKRSIYSFDVFDTLLVRDCAEPHTIFRRMEKALNVIGFCEQRIIAESLARSAGKEEVTISEIYSHLPKSYKKNLEDKQLIELEIKEEERALKPIVFMREKVNTYIRGGADVLFISDMYLSSTSIKKFLENAGYLVKEDSLFVSSDLGVSKSTGKLFQHISKTTGRAINEKWIHEGDHYNSDFVIPQKLGIDAKRFLPGILNPTESKLLGTERESVYVDQIVSNSRQSRLEAMSRDNLDKDVLPFSTAFGGMLLTQIAESIIDLAEAEGYQRLCPVSRDGYSISKALKSISAARGIPLKIDYFYGSRKAWYFPKPTEIRARIEKIISLPSVSVSLLTEELGMKNELVEDFFNQKLGREFNNNELLLKKEKLRLDEILKSLKIEDFIIQYYDSEKNDARELYFRQNASDKKTLLIDLGWNGEMISRGLDLAKTYEWSKNSNYLLIFANENGVLRTNNDNAHTLFHTCGLKRKPKFLYYFLEEVFAAPHGSAIGYQIANEMGTAVFKSSRNKEQDRRVLNTHLISMKKYLRQYVTSLPDRNDLSEKKIIIKNIIDGLLAYPDAESIKACARFSHDSKGNGEINTLVSLEEVKKIHWSLLFKAKRLSAIAWPELMTIGIKKRKIKHLIHKAISIRLKIERLLKI